MLRKLQIIKQICTVVLRVDGMGTNALTLSFDTVGTDVQVKV